MTDITIKKLIDLELERANNKFPQFKSRHEAYGVMLEEAEEAAEELEDIYESITAYYWEACRRDEEEVADLLIHLENGVNCAIKELIQLGAMIQKAKKIG
jgi:hypothetical protein